MQSRWVCCMWPLHYPCTQAEVERKCTKSLARTPKQFPQRLMSQLHERFQKLLSQRNSIWPFPACCPHLTTFSSAAFQPRNQDVLRPWCCCHSGPFKLALLHQVVPQIGFAISSHVVSIMKICLIPRRQQVFIECLLGVGHWKCFPCAMCWAAGLLEPWRILSSFFFKGSALRTRGRRQIRLWLTLVFIPVRGVIEPCARAQRKA